MLMTFSSVPSSTLVQQHTRPTAHTCNSTYVLAAHTSCSTHVQQHSCPAAQTSSSTLVQQHTCLAAHSSSSTRVQQHTRPAAHSSRPWFNIKCTMFTGYGLFTQVCNGHRNVKISLAHNLL